MEHTILVNRAFYCAPQEQGEKPQNELGSRAWLLGAARWKKESLVWFLGSQCSVLTLKRTYRSGRKWKSLSFSEDLMAQDNL